MFMYKVSGLLLILATVMAPGAHLSAKKPPEPPIVGNAIDEGDITPWDISVPPDGSTLPAGMGTVAAGGEVFASQCAACHGAAGVGGPAGSLVGGVGSLTTQKPAKTVGSYWPYATTVFDYIRRAMPYFAPGSLSDDDAYSVTAYLLHLNDIVDEDTVLTAQTLPQVEMPNRDGFISYWPTAHEAKPKK